MLARAGRWSVKHRSAFHSWKTVIQQGAQGSLGRTVGSITEKRCAAIKPLQLAIPPQGLRV
jgi:hypothetical protein